MRASLTKRLFQARGSIAFSGNALACWLLTRRLRAHQASISSPAVAIRSKCVRVPCHTTSVARNAPYRHFKDRDALRLWSGTSKCWSWFCKRARVGDAESIQRLRAAPDAFIRYGRDYQARYRLLFSNPVIAAAGLVGDAQNAETLPPIPVRELAGLIYATAHGLIDLQGGGRICEQKGLAAAAQGVALLLLLLGSSSSNFVSGMLRL